MARDDGRTSARGNEISMTKTLAEIVGVIVNELTPIGSDERKRAVQAAMRLLGEEQIKPPRSESEQSKMDGAEALPPRSVVWMRQNEISMEQLQHAFFIQDGTIEIIAQIPGNNNKEKVRNAYILV